VEKWAYFLGHVDQLEIPEIERLFQDPVFVEAGGILEMISKTEEERLRYELRMKALRDLHSNLDFAEMRGLETGRQQGLEEGRREGRQEGRQEGRLEGTIQTLQQLLGEPVTNSDELTTRDREQLEELAEVLQARMRGRLA
jgi:flagellar biosynthesis/type III secretory pathway protein FliH